MKKLTTYITLVAAVALAASCIAERPQIAGQEEGLFTLRLQTAELGTRSVRGDDALNENTIDHVDIFFFEDEAGTTLVNNGHYRLTASQLTAVSGGDNLYECVFDATDTDGNPALKGPSYVYVLANYPQTIDKTTLADILALPITSDFTKAQASFVMDSYDSADGSVLTYLKPSKAHDGADNAGTYVRESVYTINLARAAAKFVLDINVKDEFEDAAGNLWTPVTDQMWVNFVNARKATTVAADTVVFDAKANYYNSAQVSPASVTPAAKPGYTSWKIDPVYSYPLKYATSDVTAPYYKIFVPWVCEKKGMNNFYYKIVLPNLTTFQRNKIYQLSVDVSVVGGTEDDWALVTEYIYVADWWAPDAIEAVFEGAGYLDVPVKTYHIYGIDYVTVPVVSSNPITVSGSPTDASVTVTGTKQNLYGTNGNGVPYDVTVTPTISEITKDGFKLTHLLNTTVSSTNYDFTPITYTMYVNHDQSSDGALNKPIEVKIVQYPSVYAIADENDKPNTAGGVYVNSNTSSNSGWNSVAGGLNGTNKNGNMYVLNVSVSDDYIIGDPRSTSVDLLGREWNTGYWTEEAGNNHRLTNYYPGATTGNETIIAPVIRVASSYGVVQPISREEAQQRCAGYQEDGFPAGRWRLPTFAEVAFIARLSSYKHIPILFSDLDTPNGDYYWTASGAALVDNVGSDAGVTEYPDRTANSYVRCVYDEWYWGSDQIDNKTRFTWGDEKTE